MRTETDPRLMEYLLKTFAGNYVRLLEDIAIEYKDEEPIDRIIGCVFSDLANNANLTDYMSGRGILCTRNNYVHEINTQCKDRGIPRAWVYRQPKKRLLTSRSHNFQS